jgi:hypothetical protein
MRSTANTLLKVIAIGSWSKTKRCPLPILLVCAVIGVACKGEKLFELPILTTLEVAPAGASILQGGSVTVAVTLTRSGGFTVPVNLTVIGLPPGVTALVSSIQNTGRVATASVTLNVSGSTIPGAYSLIVAHGTEPTAPTATFVLTVTGSAYCPAVGVCEQWAASATASSQADDPTDWSPYQATGQANVVECADDPLAWASSQSNGVDWLELMYRQSVRPTEIQIHEVFGASSIVKVEVKDGAGTYHTVYTAQPGSQTCPRVLTIPVTGISAMVKVVRLSFDQRALNNWDEIDAVKLIGNP